MDLPLKKNIAIGRLQVDLKDLQAPADYEIVIHNTFKKNSWRFWLYDAQEKKFQT